MSYFKSIKCGRCGENMEKDFYDACPSCQKDGLNVNYVTSFDLKNAKLPTNKNRQMGIYQYRDFFALKSKTKAVSIGEGNTPIIQLKRMGKKLGIQDLFMKDESKNPTMSHKDRLCSLIVSKAIEEGAPGVVLASTGNQGASAAAYCSAAGLPCIILTTPNVSLTMKTIMQIYGASVFVTSTMENRSILLEELVRKKGFSPASGLMTPPIGSSPYGVDAYKTISFEIFKQMGNELPDWIIVPVSYGDTLFGIYKGLEELKEMGYINKIPKLIAAEVFGALETTIKESAEIPISKPSKPSIQTSIATGYTTYLTVKAITKSDGTARISHDFEALEMQQTLAKTEGVFAETASVSSLVVLKKLLKERVINPEDKVMILMTSTGIKDPETTRINLPKVPSLEPSLEDLQKKIKSYYGMEI